MEGHARQGIRNKIWSVRFNLTVGFVSYLTKSGIFLCFIYMCTRQGQVWNTKSDEAMSDLHYKLLSVLNSWNTANQEYRRIIYKEIRGTKYWQLKWQIWVRLYTNNKVTKVLVLPGFLLYIKAWYFNRRKDKPVINLS